MTVSDERSALDVFELASNSTRMDILRTLAEAYSASPTDPWLEYSDLRERADVRDKGNFNYHLDRLSHLVVKGPEGYRITGFGMGIVAAVASGVFDPEWTWGPVDAPGECLYCGASVHVRVADGIAHVECGTDEHTVHFPAPPGLLESHTDEDALERLAFTIQHDAESLSRGICPDCGGDVDGEIALGTIDDENHHFHGNCTRCGFQHGYPVGAIVVRHPAVTSFYHRRGVDVRSTPIWALEFCKPGHEEVVSEDPLRVRIAVEHDEATLSLTLDRNASVVAVEEPNSDRGPNRG